MAGRRHRLSTLGWFWYFAADATCVGGYLCSLRFEPTACRWFTGWWLGSLALPALIIPARGRSIAAHMCQKAILQLNQPVGSSCQEIRDYIRCKYGKDPSRKAIANALSKDIFLKYEGRFKLAREHQAPARDSQSHQLLGSAVSVFVTICVAVLPLGLDNAPLRFVYGMAGAFRAMRLRTLLLEPESISGVLSAATLWG